MYLISYFKNECVILIIYCIELIVDLLFIIEDVNTMKITLFPSVPGYCKTLFEFLQNKNTYKCITLIKGYLIFFLNIRIVLFSKRFSFS